MRGKVSRIILSVVTVLALAAISAAHPSERSHELGVACAYVDIDLLVPSHALHYMNPGPLDVSLDLDGSEDSLDASSETAECRADDQWHIESAFGLSVLHSWVWLGNPNGMFADFNPRVD